MIRCTSTGNQARGVDVNAENFRVSRGALACRFITKPSESEAGQREIQPDPLPMLHLKDFEESGAPNMLGTFSLSG